MLLSRLTFSSLLCIMFLVPMTLQLINLFFLGIDDFFLPEFSTDTEANIKPFFLFSLYYLFAALIIFFCTCRAYCRIGFPIYYRYSNNLLGKLISLGSLPFFVISLTLLYEVYNLGDIGGYSHINKFNWHQYTSFPVLYRLAFNHLPYLLMIPIVHFLSTPKLGRLEWVTVSLYASSFFLLCLIYLKTIHKGPVLYVVIYLILIPYMVRKRNSKIINDSLALFVLLLAGYFIAVSFQNFVGEQESKSVFERVVDRISAYDGQIFFYVMSNHFVELDSERLNYLPNADDIKYFVSHIFPPLRGQTTYTIGWNPSGVSPVYIVVKYGVLPSIFLWCAVVAVMAAMFAKYVIAVASNMPVMALLYLKLAMYFCQFLVTAVASYPEILTIFSLVYALKLIRGSSLFNSYKLQLKLANTPKASL